AVGLGVGHVRNRGVRVHRGDPAIEAKLVGLRREAALVEHRLERAVLLEQLRGRLRADALRTGELVGRIAAQGDEVRHLRRLDAVAFAHLGRTDARDLADTPQRLEDRRPLARQLERVAVAARDEDTAAAVLLVRDGRGEEVVGLVTWRLPDRE